MRHHSILLHLFAFALFCSLSVAAETPPVSQTLFNGRDTTGWQISNCTVEIQDGALLLKEGDGFVRSDLEYQDFILELDYKALRTDMYDSGIYIRSEFPNKNPKRAWPDRYQINLKKGDELNLLGVKGAKSTGLIKLNDWNHIKLKVVGNKAEMEINGQAAWSAEGLEVARGYIGFQSEVAGGGQFLFKNIKLTELGYTPLFNGQDLTGWTGDTKGYLARDGAIVCEQGKGGFLYTAEKYDNFALRFEFKLEPGTNNGLAIRAPGNGDPAYTGFELQILDDGHTKYKNIAPWQAHGSVYGIAPAKRGHLKPAGEWNSQEVIVNGRQITITLNGVVINDINLDEVAPMGKTIDGKGDKHLGFNNTTGYIGFCGHGDQVAYRNLRLKKITPKQ